MWRQKVRDAYGIVGEGRRKQENLKVVPVNKLSILPEPKSKAGSQVIMCSVFKRCFITHELVILQLSTKTYVRNETKW